MSVRIDDAPPPVRSGRNLLRSAIRHENALILGALVVLIVIFTLWAPPGSFLSPQNVANISLDASELLILAAGVTFLIIAGGLDLSVGAVIVFASIVSGKVMIALAGPIAESLKSPPLVILGVGLVGVVVAVAIGCAWGLFNSLVILRLRVPPIISTLATLSIALGLAEVISGGVNVSGIPVQLQTYFGGGKLGIIPWPVIVAVVVVAVMWILLAKTRFGLRTYAIGGNEQAARRAGIPVRAHMLKLYTIVGLLAGIDAFIDLTRFGTASIAGHTQDALNVIAAVVIGGVSLFGGRGRMSGAIIGVFIPAVLANGFVVVRVDPFWQNVAVGVVLIAAVYTDQLRRGAGINER
jgi:ribose transport system permease protein